jgi:phosphohistidine phosphatase SixA
VQSAKILADEWELPICEEPSLGNDFDAERVLQLASEAEDDATLLFLGHGGPMDQLVETLAGEPLLPSGLPKSGAIILTFPAAIEAGAAKGHELLNPGAG